MNIGFVNELSLIFDRLKIDTLEVLEAAGTKWNFLPFRPGLVGGHCIGVDPYYLTFKAQELGYTPEVILSGRRINDAMGAYVAKKVIKALIERDCALKGSKVLMLGVTFKENCPDIRNSRAVDVYYELKEFGINVEVHDPWANEEEVLDEYGIHLVEKPNGPYNAIILAVSHQEFYDLKLADLKDDNTVVFDIKSFFPKEQVTERL